MPSTGEGTGRTRSIKTGREPDVGRCAVSSRMNPPYRPILGLPGKSLIQPEQRSVRVVPRGHAAGFSPSTIAQPPCTVSAIDGISASVA